MIYNIYTSIKGSKIGVDLIKLGVRAILDQALVFQSNIAGLQRRLELDPLFPSLLNMLMIMVAALGMLNSACIRV